MAIDFHSSITYTNLLLAYDITMFSMWGIGVDIARLLIRYAKSYPMVINIHSISMMIIGLMTLLYVITKTCLFYSSTIPINEYTGIYLAQLILSWLLCVFVSFQFVLGFKVRYEMVMDKISVEMFNLKKIHKYVGILMSIFGKIIVALELQIYQKSHSQFDYLFKTWMFIIGAQILIFIILQVLYRIQTRTLMLKFPLKHKSRHTQYLDKILQNIKNNQQNFNDYKQIGLRYIILDNKMYYIDQNFIHPGGQHIFTMYNGEQINYLFKGTHFPIPDFPRHNHTKYVINYLEQRLVGKIQVQSILVNFNQDSQDLIEWKINAIQEMDGNCNLVEFQPNNGDVQKHLNVQTFGKYIMMGCPTQQIISNQKRPYSLIISQNSYHQKILQRFKQAYKRYYSSQSSLASIIHHKNGKSDESVGKKSALRFCIKKYKNGTFTQFLFSSQADKKFSIMGPYGRGLRLNSKSAGYYIIIAAGTGILPFIDLFHYMLLKTLLELIGAMAGEQMVKKLNEERLDYGVLNGVKILLIGSFQGSKYFYLDSVIKDLYHLNKKHENIDNFTLKLRYSNNESEPEIEMIKDFFDTKFIKQLLGQNPDRIYYCGPPTIEKIIRKVSEECQDKNIFYFL